MALAIRAGVRTRANRLVALTLELGNAGSRCFHFGHEIVELGSRLNGMRSRTAFTGPARVP